MAQETPGRNTVTRLGQGIHADVAAAEGGVHVVLRVSLSPDADDWLDRIGQVVLQARTEAEAMLEKMVRVEPALEGELRALREENRALRGALADVQRAVDASKKEDSG